MKNQKGFIQIPLLIAILIASVSVASVGTGVVLYKQQKTPLFTANVSEVFYQVLYEKKFEMEELKQETELSKIRQERAEKHAQEEIVKRTEAEAAKKEAEQIAQKETIKRTQEETARKKAEEKKQQEEIARKAAEEKAKQEEIAKKKAEEKASQEKAARKAKEQELAEKEAEEKKMNADDDGDGLTYRRELELGTSDWNTDSDGDGVKDGEDAHPAGGGRNIAQNFEWEYERTVWTWNYSIQEDWYKYYNNKNQPRSQSPQGIEFITPNDPFIKEIAKALRETADKENYHLTSFIVSFVQGLPYVEDYYTTFDEYPKYPIETFVERNGDCEDTSYLFASLAQSTGRAGASLVEFHNHMGVGIKTVHSQSGYYYPIGDDWYYYYETTGEGWEVGEIPSDYLYEKAKLTRVWDGSVHYSYPQYVKPCYASSDFPGYYSDGENYYSDRQCNYLVHCLLYEGYYYNPKTQSFYWDSGCNQIVVKGCYKSTSYPGYFYKSGVAWYFDSKCTQLYKSMSCNYPSSITYSCIYEFEYTLKKGECENLARSGMAFSGKAAVCNDELIQCRNDIDEYKRKLNEYNQCLTNKEY